MRNSYNKYAGMTFGEASIARKTDREANKAKNEAQRARKIASAMTCQCCARQIFAETGTIAHHGYQRPGGGWQTASCMGAKHLPFEVDRAQLGTMIRAIEARLARTDAHLADVVAERVPVPFNYTTRERISYGRSTERSVDVTRATFFDVKEAYASEMVRRSVRVFDDVKGELVRKLQFIIRNDEQFRVEQQKRFDGWKQTHARKDDAWVKI